MADERLLDAAHHIFDTLVDGLTAEGVVVPERRYVHTGLIAHDLAGANCAEAFIVSWTNSFQGLLGSEERPFIQCSMPLTVQMSVVLLRCVPTVNSQGKAPTPSQLEAAADQLMVDAWTLPAVVISQTVVGTLRQERIELVGINSVNAIGPQGGVGGCEVIMFVTIL